MKLPNLLRRVAAPHVRNELPGFDPVYYQYWYRDTLPFVGGPALHYLCHGWKEGRDPSAGFSTLGYLNANPDVLKSGEIPLIHFLDRGLAEGRKGWEKNPSLPPPRVNGFDTSLKLLAPPR